MNPLITVKGLNKTFITPERSLNVLKDISLEIAEGELTALTGPSGVGKSTLLHIIGTLDRPTSGEVLYKGKDVFKYSSDELARFRSSSIGFVFQFHHLLPEFNTLENTLLPALIAGISHEDAHKKAKQLLGKVGLSERFTHKPGELSGGEQQRVAVARALMLEPEVVLADEPTGNLDTGTGEELFNLLKSLNETGTSFIIVTHNETLASQCRRTIKMKDGTIL